MFNIIISVFCIIVTSFFNLNSVDPASNPNQVILDIIDASYRMENLYASAVQLDYKLDRELEKKYNDDELRNLSYDLLLEIDEDLIKRKINLCTKKEKKKELKKLTRAVAREQGISPTLLVSLIEAESHYRCGLTSKAGAKGLCQIMPFNYKDLNIKDPFDVLQNMRGGSKYLRYLINKFDHHIGLALAAYNAGPSSIRNGKIPPYKETRNYVKKVAKNFRKNKKG